MTPFETGLISLGAVLVLVIGGMYVPVALMLCAFGGIWAIKGSPALATTLVARTANEAIASYFFGIVPLFVLMGLVVAESGLGRDAYTVARACFGRLRGGLGVATVAANTLFAAITGISIASAAVFARVAVPEMRRDGHSVRFATGVVAGSSVLGMLIPPSLLLILYAILAEQSIGDLFIAGILPGLLLATLFCTGIVTAAYLAPGLLGGVRADDGAERTPLDDSPTGLDTSRGESRPVSALVRTEGKELTARELLSRLLPILALAVLVLGGIYSGQFTPIEAGAVGTAGAFAIAMLKRRLDAATSWRVLIDAALVSASIGLLIVAAQVYARMLAFSGLPVELAALANGVGLGYWGLMLGYVAVLVLMGTILDSASILLVAVPIMLPVVAPLDVDLVWFGIVTVLAIEIGLLTPPFGLSVHVIATTLDDASIRLGDVFVGALPFASLTLVVVGLLLCFPELATVLLDAP